MSTSNTMKDPPQELDAGAWKSALASEFPGARARVGPAFGTGRFSISPLASGVVTSISSGPQSVDHTPQTFGRWGQMISVLVQLEGEAELRHGGGRTHLSKGGLVLVDTDVHASFEFAGAYHQVFALVPGARVGALGSGAFGTPAAQSPIDRLLFENVAGLVAAAPLMNATQQALALDALVALLKISTLTPSADRRLVGKRLERALTFIDAHLADRDLCAQAVARSQGVSRRFLDELFHAAGSTIEQTIWERRLNRAAVLLREDDGRSVLTIAVDCGFSNASHFASAFRRRFGHNPSQHRLAATKE